MDEYIKRQGLLDAYDAAHKGPPGGARKLIAEAPAEDVVPVADLKEFARDVAYQFGYYVQHNGRLHIIHGGLSTLEWAFDILGWENPHPYPEGECEWDGCHEHATCGTPTPDGYKRLCSKHMGVIVAREEAERAARKDGE